MAMAPLQRHNDPPINPRGRTASPQPAFPTLMRRLLDTLCDLVLGTDSKQRLRLRRTLMGAGVYFFSLLAQFYSVSAGHTPSGDARALALFVAIGQIGFYVALRSGWSLRLKDPALTLVQMGYASVALAVAYAINPSIRTMWPLAMALVLVFGAFILSPARCLQLGLVAVAALGTSMAWSAWRRPELYPPALEFLHFMFCATVLPAIASLAGQLSAIRARSQRQKTELREALERIRLLATRDDLTGLPNRRHAEQLLALEESRAQRQGSPLALAMVDIDSFKRINDTFGHAAGDRVLQLISAHAPAGLRDTDVIARWGGEEFLLILPDADVDAALQVVQRLRELIAQPQTWGADAALKVTFSAGIALWHDGESMHQTLARADAALYRAKAQGRDRTIAAETPAGTAPQKVA